MTNYVNLHGQPLDVSASDAVRAAHPSAFVVKTALLKGEVWTVYKTSHRQAVIIGTGANPESAWRDAWSRMLADDMQREGGK